MSIEANPQLSTSSTDVKKMKMSRKMEQVFDTVSFEIQKNLKKTLLVAIVFSIFYILSLVAKIYRENQGEAISTDPVDYVSGFLGFISFMIYISSSAYAGSMICEDFEKQTGNLLFPKISKDRLMMGRFIALFGMNAFVLILYYMLVGITILVKYDTIPIELWYSMGWAVLYALMIFCFVMFFSSFMKSTAATVVVSIIFLLIGFDLIEGILSLVSTSEPVWLPTHYGKIISAILNMPEDRKYVMEIPDTNLTITSWMTPSVNVAAIGMIVYIAIFFIAAYLLFLRRQAKE